MRPIDPVELALAAVGVRPIISRKVERIGAGTVTEMARMPGEIRRAAVAVMRGETARVPLGDANYETLLRDLTDTFNHAQIEAMVAMFPPRLKELGPGFLVLADKVVSYLLSLLPRQVKMTLLGPVNLPPPEQAFRRFVSALVVLEDPMRVFALVASGSLLKGQVEAMRTIYPTMSAAIEDAMRDAAEREKAAVKSYEVPALVEISVATWLGRPMISPTLSAAMAANHDAAKIKAQNARPAPASASVAAKAAMSNTQRSLYRETLGKD